MQPYIHIFLLIIIAVVFSGMFVLLSRLVGPQLPTPQKLSTYESGVPVKGRLMGKFSVKYFAVIILFLLFDLEVVFLFPWAIQQNAIGNWWFWFGEGLIFAIILLVGWVYAVKMGILNWYTPKASQNSDAQTDLLPRSSHK
jgi:NADH-quinone oxidoreductase subunit A